MLQIQSSFESSNRVSFKTIYKVILLIEFGWFQSSKARLFRKRTLKEYIISDIT